LSNRARERESNAPEQRHLNDQFSVLQITKDQRDLIQTEDEVADQGVFGRLLNYGDKVVKTEFDRLLPYVVH
jgi:hypothetical protein